MLSAHERKQLETIEAALQADDPVWSDQFVTGRPRRPRARVLRAALWGVVLAVWPALLVTGIVLGVTPLVIVAATVLALSPAAAVLLILHQLCRKD
ncbi:DUF3040 domain-containing protein [Streptomyces sp. NBC_01262]|uniref:DUF3040 domain-containing protein n=1 Tax=Streptomyces sp. NBC_01262 TaxID=2903803 RepID=UPI002E34CA02|nr:DUF3040 domain-containing protein [Streptomyces sp. NBC_01262]